MGKKGQTTNGRDGEVRRRKRTMDGHKGRIRDVGERQEKRRKQVKGIEYRYAVS